MQLKTELAASFVKHSEHPEDVLGNLDIKSLYPSIPVAGAMVKLVQKENFSQHVIQHSEPYLQITCFGLNGNIFDQPEGAPVGPLIANLYMINFDVEA